MKFSKLIQWMLPFTAGILFAVALFWLGANSSTAAPLRVLLAGSPPTVVSYQGQIITATGEPYEGQGSFKFAVVDAPTGSGSANAWANDGTAAGEPAAAVTLVVTQGLFNVMLGDTGLAGMTAGMDETAFASSGAYLRVWFRPAGDTGPFTALEPNRQVGSVPYALRAQYAENPGPQGPQGEVGPEGPEGAIGPVGPAGPMGDKGATGPTGPIGPAGPQGATGPAGPEGPEGPEGPSGLTGPMGPRGFMGHEGPPGPTGPQGPAGPQGATGATGAQGPAGPKGDTGATGPQGPTGSTGLPGATGPQGPSGIVNIQSIGNYNGGNVPSSNWFTFMGPTVTYTVTADQRITASITASVTSATVGNFFHTICYQQGSNSLQTLSGSGVYHAASVPVSPRYLTYSSNSTGKLPAGTYKFGFCTYSMNIMLLYENVAGWVMLTN